MTHGGASTRSADGTTTAQPPRVGEADERGLRGGAPGRTAGEEPRPRRRSLSLTSSGLLGDLREELPRASNTSYQRFDGATGGRRHKGASHWRTRWSRCERASMAAYDRDDRGGTSREPPGGHPATDPDEPAIQGATAKPRGHAAPVLSAASSRASSGTRLSSRRRHHEPAEQRVATNERATGQVLADVEGQARSSRAIPDRCRGTLRDLSEQPPARGGGHTRHQHGREDQHAGNRAAP